MSTLTAICLFLTDTVFKALLFFLWMRVICYFFQVSIYQVSYQSIIHFSTPVIRPLILFFKNKKIYSKKYDYASLTGIVLLQMLQLIILWLLAYNTMPQITMLLLSTLIHCSLIPLNIFFYAILIQIIINFLQPNWRHAILELIALITYPILLYVRTRIKDIFPTIKLQPDYTPFILLLLIQCVSLTLEWYISTQPH